jgi:hypothetical protein
MDQLQDASSSRRRHLAGGILANFDSTQNRRRDAGATELREAVTRSSLVIYSCAEQ